MAFRSTHKNTPSSGKGVNLWKVAGALHKPKGILSHSKKPQISYSEGCILFRFFIHHLQKSRFQVKCREDPCSHQTVEGLLNMRKWIGVFLGLCVQLPKVNTEAQSSIFLVDQHHCITPRTIRWSYGPSFQHLINVLSHLI